MTNTDENDFGALTVAEFCERYRLGHTTAYELIKGGALKARKVGARTVLLHSDVKAWERSLPTMQ
jgi:excisionase family DNA binding protein